MSVALCSQCRTATCRHFPYVPRHATLQQARRRPVVAFLSVCCLCVWLLVLVVTLVVI